MCGPRTADAGRTQYREGLETMNRREDEGQLCPYQSRDGDLRLAESSRNEERLASNTEGLISQRLVTST